jgi:hypothetical protein
MTVAEFKNFVRITAVLLFLSFGALILYRGTKLLSWEALGDFGTAITITTCIWLLFIKLGWRWPFLSSLFCRPDLNGTWIGQFNTDWKDEKGRGRPDSPFMAVIRQTFLSIHVTTHTQGFIASSYSESLVINKKNGVDKLVYLYSRDTTSVGDDDNRHGAAEFRIIMLEAPELQGHYWSKQKTTGYISLCRVSTKPVDSYSKASAVWPKDKWNVILPKL